ncbi:MAG TPA: CHRD domain-containing protein, partial [Nitrososphaeraceae archaeon]|nr:CHRD domain-containing protein [Nitrososphaeraceae archaeon]
NYIDFRVNVSNLDDITAAHLHLGEFGQNGEIIAPVLKPQRQFDYSSGTKTSTPVDVPNGTLVEGKVTSAELIGSRTVKTITELVQLFNNTQTYVNIHT